jgi:hypothetical protein
MVSCFLELIVFVLSQFEYLGASFRKRQAEGRAAPGSAALRFFTAQGTGAVKELNPLHPWRKFSHEPSVFVIRLFILRNLRDLRE